MEYLNLYIECMGVHLCKALNTPTHSWTYEVSGESRVVTIDSYVHYHYCHQDTCTIQSCLINLHQIIHHYFISNTKKILLSYPFFIYCILLIYIIFLAAEE